MGDELRHFASAERPLRASRLPGFLRCPMSAVIDWMSEGSDAGSAADTGSAVHMAARAFHGPAKQDAAIALEVMRQALPKYPLADLGAAEAQFRWYSQDPRNKGAKVVLLEAEGRLTLPAEAQEAVVIQGTMDQVREERGSLVLWDIKTGGLYEGESMLPYYCAQLCAYQLLATQMLGRPVVRCGVIRTKDYLKSRKGPVFWEAPWSLCDAEVVVSQVVQEVLRIRRGEVRATPSAEQCKYCTLMSVGNCLRRRESLCKG